MKIEFSRSFSFEKAAISTLKMSTKCATDQMGTEIEFDEFGAVRTKNVKVMPQNGTTVQIHNLFHRIPVRRSVLKQNSKRELQKTLGILMAYALMSQSRIVVQTENGKSRKTALQTKGTETLKAKISSVLGRGGK